MEIGLREWLIVGGVILILLIIIDGWRRMQSGRNRLKMNIDKNFVDAPPPVDNQAFNPELPGGGARRVALDSDPLFSDHRPELAPDKDAMFTPHSETLQQPDKHDWDDNLSLDDGIVSPVRTVTSASADDDISLPNDFMASGAPETMPDTQATPAPFGFSEDGILGPARVVPTPAVEPEPPLVEIEQEPSDMTLGSSVDTVQDAIEEHDPIDEAESATKSEM
ncbi:MAG: hypothetical protein ACJARJ_002036, partial [Neptuniibacter pectenicola]